MDYYKNSEELIRDILLGILACLAAVGAMFLFAMAIGVEIVFK